MQYVYIYMDISWYITIVKNPILSHLYGPSMVDNLAPKVSSLGFASRSLEPLQMRSSFRASPGRFSEIWRFPKSYSYGMLWYVTSMVCYSMLWYVMVDISNTVWFISIYYLFYSLLYTINNLLTPYEGFHKWGGTPIAGWFMSGKIKFKWMI
jgi:hypothetical protein